MYKHFGCVNICAHAFFVCGPKFTGRRLENFGEDIPASPDAIEAHTLNFKPNFKFSRLIFFSGGTPVHVGGWAR